MRPTAAPSFALLLTVLLAAACGPNAENEAQYWQNNQKSIATLGEKWPGFKPHLEAKLTAAKPVWDEATKVSDEKKKAEKMKSVNSMLSPLLSRVEEVKYKSESLKNRIEDLNRLKLAKTQHQLRNDAVSTGYEKLAEVESAMVSATPGTEEAALEIVDEQISTLISARGAVDRAYNNVKPKKAKKIKSKSKKRK